MSSYRAAHNRHDALAQGVYRYFLKSIRRGVTGQNTRKSTLNSETSRNFLRFLEDEAAEVGAKKWRNLEVVCVDSCLRCYTL